MKIGLLIILFLIGNGIVCQASGLQPFVVTFNKYDYNASSKNWSVAVNSKGLVYVANSEGLLEGDGQSWKLYKIPTGGELRSLAIDEKDRIYTGSYEEFGFWETDDCGRLSYTSLSDSLTNHKFHNEQIWKIIIRNDTVYFQAFNRVFIYKDEKVKITDTQSIIFLMEAGDRLIAQRPKGALVELINDEFKVIKESDHLNGSEIKVTLPLGKSAFLLGSGTTGLYKWSDGEITIWESEAHNVLKDKQINHGLFYNGSYYVGTITDGVYIFSSTGEIIGHLNTNNGLLNNTILGMGFDKKGNLWLNHDKGLSFVQFSFPYINITSATNDIGAVHAAAVHNGNIYLGTNQGLYYSSFQENNLADLKIKHFGIIEGSQGQVWDLKVFDGQLLCGHNKGTFRVEADDFIRVSSYSGGFCLRKFPDEMLIQSTYNNLLLYRKDENGYWEYFRRITGITEPMKYVESDFRGNLWVSHNRKGFYKLELNQDASRVISKKEFGKQEGFTQITKTHVFKIDNRIVFTSGQGIFTYDDLKDSIISYNDLNSTIGEFKNAEKIVEANDNLYWFMLSNKAGLFFINGNKIEPQLQLIFNREGYHLVDMNPNIVPLSATEHLVCLEDGIMIINPEHQMNNSEISPIVIREVLSGENKNLPLKSESIPEVKYSSNSVKFLFSPILFPGDGNQFSTKLEGLDKNWEPYNKESSKMYSRLPWGEYTFRVKGINEFGKQIPETTYSFKVTPPWYATGSAYVIYLALVLAFFILFPVAMNRYFRKQKEAYKSKQEKIYREKQKEHQLMAEQKIVRLQNQHLQKELEIKSKEIANNAMVIIRRNETLTEIKGEFEKQKEILGSRFPNKNYEKIIKLIDKNLSSEEEWKVFEDNFDQAHNNFFKRLKKKFPTLTPGDLRLCAYLHLNLTSKEIAPLLNISIRGVEIHRYRLRKKLGLSNEENLVEFVMQF